VQNRVQVTNPSALLFPPGHEKIGLPVERIRRSGRAEDVDSREQ